MDRQPDLQAVRIITHRRQRTTQFRWNLPDPAAIRTVPRHPFTPNRQALPQHIHEQLGLGPEVVLQPLECIARRTVSFPRKLKERLESPPLVLA